MRQRELEKSVQTNAARCSIRVMRQGGTGSTDEETVRWNFHIVIAERGKRDEQDGNVRNEI